MSDYVSDDEMSFTVGIRTYMYEPDYTVEELYRLSVKGPKNREGR